MSLRTSKLTLGLIAAVACLPPAQGGGNSPLFAAQILGEVHNPVGIVQMGAKVFLYNRYDQLVRQTITNEAGKFGFDALPADSYSIRVTLASFVPAIRRNIAVAAGSESVLNINLAAMLSTVELMSAPSPGTILTDDWKWVLRASQATRPVLRFTPDAKQQKSRSSSAMFSKTNGMLRLSAGEGESITGGSQQDLGTAFAVSTSIRDSGQVRLSGNLALMQNSGLPSAGFRTTYTKDKDGATGPQVSLTVRQVYLPMLAGSGPLSDQQTGPVLRTASLGTMDKIDLLDSLRLEYGFNLDSVSFLQRLNHGSPFARASYDLGEDGMLRLAFSGGTQPSQLASYDGQIAASDLNQDLAALSLLPRVSQRDGETKLQRSETFEAGYELAVGRRKFSANIYREQLSDAAYTMSAPPGFMSSSDVLPDLDSRSFVFNVGDYQRSGYSGAVTQAVGDHAELTLAAGRGGALVADSQEATSTKGDDIRNSMHKEQRPWVTMRASADVPWLGAHLSTSYGWTDFRSLMPAHISLTEKTYQDTGWNFYARQPLPGMGGRRGRLEAMVEVRNMLAQGYLPLTVGGRRAILTNSPRALRGGLNFIF